MEEEGVREVCIEYLRLWPAHLVYGTVVAEVAAVLARADRVLGPAAADLAEGAVGVRPAAGAAHVVLREKY